MANKLWIDPPSGWRYGFPKIWDPEHCTDIRTWMIDCGYPEDQVDFAMDYCRQWPAAEDEYTDSANRSVDSGFEYLRDEFQKWEGDFVDEHTDSTNRNVDNGFEYLRDEFQKWESNFVEERTAFWDSLTKDQQLLAFCEVVSRLVQGELVEDRSYRGVLYDTFGFGPDSYVAAQVSGFLDLHNSIERKS